MEEERGVGEKEGAIAVTAGTARRGFSKGRSKGKVLQVGSSGSCRMCRSLFGHHKFR